MENDHSDQGDHRVEDDNDHVVYDDDDDDEDENDEDIMKSSWKICFPRTDPQFCQTFT